MSKPHPPQEGDWVMVPREPPLALLTKIAHAIQPPDLAQPRIKGFSAIEIAKAAYTAVIAAAPPSPDLEGQLAEREAEIATLKETQLKFGTMMHEEMSAREKAEAYAGKIALMEKAFQDPGTVHLNMLHGYLAKPTPAQIGFLYRGAEAVAVVDEVRRQNPEAFA